MSVRDFPEPRTAPQRTKIMATYRAIVAELELEAGSLRDRIAAMPRIGQAAYDYNPDRQFSEGQATAIGYAIRLVNNHFRHIHVRHETDNRKCAACGQDLMHEVHKRTV